MVPDNAVRDNNLCGALASPVQRQARREASCAADEAIYLHCHDDDAR